MAKYVGLDWASKGWFGVMLDDADGWEADVFPSIWSAWKYHSDADRILVDVPVGLPSGGKRACDVEAKAMLGQRQSSVFYAPTREAVYEESLTAAKEVNETAAGFSIQNQAWSIAPRIREVDEFLDMYPSARDRVVETHPEVCYCALNGGTPLEHSKHTEAGVAERRDLLADEAPELAGDLDETIETYTTPRYAPMVSGADDVLDAAVAAVTARLPEEECDTLPDAPPVDERGLAMRIRYPSTTEQLRLSSLSASE